MTRRTLRKRLLLVSSTLGFIIAAAGALKFSGFTDVYDVVGELFPLVVALLAVVVADWFQQRAIFVQSLRALWSHLIEAKTEVTSYIHDPHRTEQSYLQAFKALSRAIDEMRGVYRNVGEDASSIGRFPYEPLHDIRRVLVNLASNSIANDEACTRVERAWNSFRPRFLAEFNPPAPTDAITTPDSSDPRRDKEPECTRPHPGVEKQLP